jgi:hypothetical protein
MPSGRRNRVTPYGELIAVPARGMFWGNRGALVDSDGSLARYSRGKAWMICVLSYKGIRRQQWTPGRLTELFFLDEATALAAGHRPCGECRYRDYQEFKHCWATALGNPPHAAPRTATSTARTDPTATSAARTDPTVRTATSATRMLPRVHEIDARLHEDRLAGGSAGRGARRDPLAGAEVRHMYTAPVSALPDGAMADLDGTPYLVLDGRLLRWTPGGYTGDPAPIAAFDPVNVITPRSTVAILTAGYRPILHETAIRSR